MSPHMSPPMPLSKLEHVMILHHVTHDPVYLRLIHLLSQTEMHDDIEESRAKVTLMLGRSGLLDLTDEDRTRARQPDSPFSLESTGWSHLRHV